MRIGIDAYEANVTQRVGIGQYAFQTLSGLYRLDKQNEYFVFLPTPPLADMPKENERWQYVIGRPVSFWTIRELPRLIKNHPVDVFFSPTHYIPWFTPIPKVLAIMDVSYLYYPELFRTKDLLQLKYMGLYSIKRAKKILTISEFSKKEIVEHYKYPETNIEVTYPGIDEKMKTIKSESPKRNPDRPYILFVGTMQPRKNVERLISAFEQLAEDVDLVLVGKKGWLYESIFTKIAHSPKKEHIKWLDFVSQEELVQLYTNARCFVLPSLYEGFGIPVADALFYNCPVVISQTTSLPEVAGDGGIYVDPLTPTSIAEGLHKALQLSPEERKKLVQVGQAHIQQFTWEACARKTLAVLNSFAKGNL